MKALYNKVKGKHLFLPYMEVFFPYMQNCSYKYTCIVIS